MLYLGSAWYPEQWPEDRWPRDVALMRQAEMNVVRIGDYAWSRLEPEEGRLDLDWMERAIDLAVEHGLEVVICTPTDAPPAWMTQRYPDVLRTDETGKRVGHGGRRHFSPTSPRYREFSRKIASTLAQRFGRRPGVIGWQIGNEYVHPSYDEATLELFHSYLERKHGSLDVLNRRWGTQYWSQTYTAWSQVPFPVGWHNPGLVLDHSRFVTQCFVDYQRDQIDALREHVSPDRWITHNSHGYDKIDWRTISQDLDLASWDVYVGDRAMDPVRLGWISDRCRCLRPRPHWIMETQPWHVNWSPVNRTLPKGGFRALIWHYLAHGAEAVLFWQWRAGLGGQEQYHGTVLGHDGEPGPAYGEIQRAGREMKRVAGVFADQRVRADVAIVQGYTDCWAIEGQRMTPAFDMADHLSNYYRPLRKAGHDVDVIDPADPFEGYRLILAPSLHLLTPELVGRIEAFVRQGGHFLLGPRSGFKDEHNALLPSRQPGDRLAELLGASVEGYLIPAERVPAAGPIGSGWADVWTEFLTCSADDAQVLLSYGASVEGWSEGRAAMVTRRVGEGRISCLGAWLEASLMEAAVGWACEHSAASTPALAPAVGVEVSRRPGRDGERLIVINHQAAPAVADLPRAYIDELTGDRLEGSVELAPHGVMVLREA